MADQLITQGWRDWQRAIAKSDKATKKEIRNGLRRAAEPVRREWVKTFSRIDTRSASKLVTRVRARGLEIDQSLRRSQDPARRRPKFTRMQQRHGVDALRRKGDQVEGELLKAVDELVDILES